MLGKREKMEKEIADARRMFPDMPEEVFEWFKGRIEANGWPAVGVDWRGALRKKSIEYWQQLVWRKQEVELGYERLTGATQNIIKLLYEAHFLSKPNFFSREHGREKIVDILKYVGENNALPSNLIFLKENHLYEIVDGCHRLTVFFALKWLDNTEVVLDYTQSAWVGYCAS